MEVEQLKSTTEDQMMMMMQMEKLPEVYGVVYNDIVELPQSQHADHNNMSINGNAMAHFVENPQVGSVSTGGPFINLPTNTISFTGSTPVQKPNFSFSPSSGGTSTSTGSGAGAGSNAFCQKKSSMGAMREMIFRIAAMQPIQIDPESVKPPKRRNVKISKDPQSVAARHRRERISERIRILQRLVPGGTKMDTASMLDEAIHYVKFLKTQVQSLERTATYNKPPGLGYPVTMSNGNIHQMGKPYQQPTQNLEEFGDAWLIKLNKTPFFP